MAAAKFAGLWCQATATGSSRVRPCGASTTAVVVVLVAGVLAGAAGGWIARGGGGSGGDASSTAASGAGAPGKGSQPYVVAASPVDAGRYLVRVGGCNECHTLNFMQKGMEVPESEWLTGLPVGWRGPWGTTYASNLRLYVQNLNEDTFVTMARNRHVRPPMPWTSLDAASDADLRAIFKYIKSLPVSGEKMPDYVAPGADPATPYFTLTPQAAKGGKPPVQ